MKALFYNILGGLLASAFMALGIWFCNWCRYLRLQKLLGISFNKVKKVSLVYGKMELPKNENLKRFPFVKPPRNTNISQDTNGRRISISSPLSECEIRATNYISSLFGTTRRIEAPMVSDVDSLPKLDATFISLGGPFSNYKTEEILDAPENIFVRMISMFGTTAFEHRNQPIHMNKDDFQISGKPIDVKPDHDYGLILRITPREHPNNAWLVCAGIGEWGTSGATRYLAKECKALIRKLGLWQYKTGMFPIPDFAVIVEVRIGQDESARIIKVFTKRDGRAVEVDVS